MYRVVARNLRALQQLQPQMHLRPQLRCFGEKSGTVKFFNAEKGFGFISSGEGDDYFVHYSAIESEGFRSLADGEDVEFDVELESSGKKRAIRVTGPGGAQVKGAPRQERDY